MSELPRLPPSAEHRLVKALAGLSPRLIRRLFGPRPRIDGQILAADTHVIVRLAYLSGGGSFLAGMSVEEARRSARHEATVISRRPGIARARVEEMTIPGHAGSIATRLYVPHGLRGDAPAPLTVYFHGGGFVVGDLDTHDGACRFLASAAGTAILSVDYRLAPEHPFPGAVEDAWAAFSWAAENAASLGFDPARIAVGGDSAGGNLSAVVGMLAREAGGARPAMQLLIYPVTDAAGRLPSRRTFADGFLLNETDIDQFDACYLPEGIDRSDPRISILEAPDLRDLPPAYLATAGFDPLRDEGEAFGLRLREAGVTVAMRRHPGLVHSFANQVAISPTAAAAMLEAAGALRMGLAPAAAVLSPS
jgi:acetyl esterase